MTVKHSIEDVAAGDSLIQDAEKLGSDIAGDTGADSLSHFFLLFSLTLSSAHGSRTSVLVKNGAQR